MNILGGGGGVATLKIEDYSKFQIWDCFFFRFFSFSTVFQFWPILTGSG